MDDLRDGMEKLSGWKTAESLPFQSIMTSTRPLLCCVPVYSYTFHNAKKYTKYTLTQPSKHKLDCWSEVREAAMDFAIFKSAATGWRFF